MAVKTAKANEQVETIEIPALHIKEVEVTLVGDSPLIVHRWSDKAKRQILDKQMKRAKQGKAAKDPEQEYKDSLYTLPDGSYGFPAVGVKAAAVSACAQIDGVFKTQARAAFHINGEFVKIDGTPEMREDMVRISIGVADIRCRAEFKQWRMTFKVRFNANVISAEQLLNLFNTAGFGVGLGEWRPEKDGAFGLFHVE